MIWNIITSNVQLACTASVRSRSARFYKSISNQCPCFYEFTCWFDFVVSPQISFWWVCDGLMIMLICMQSWFQFRTKQSLIPWQWMMSGVGSVFWVHINDMYLPIFWSLSTTSQLKSTIHRYILLSMPIKILKLKYIFRYHVLCVVCTGSVYPHWIVFM